MHLHTLSVHIVVCDFGKDNNSDDSSLDITCREKCVIVINLVTMGSIIKPFHYILQFYFVCVCMHHSGTYAYCIT